MLQKESNIPQRPYRHSDFPCPLEERHNIQHRSRKGERTPPKHPMCFLLRRGSGGSWGGCLGVASRPLLSPCPQLLMGWWWLWGARNNTGWGHLSLTSRVSLNICKMRMWLLPRDVRRAPSQEADRSALSVPTHLTVATCVLCVLHDRLYFKCSLHNSLNPHDSPMR